MLVQIKDSNAAYYADLFNSMKEFCKSNNIPNAPDEIKDLPTYYQFLEKVRALGNYDLIRIPAEEEYFEIDANTREIKVPDAFSKEKNRGICVQGDNTAEVVFFRIARFFDEMDLAVCQTLSTDSEQQGECYIQWRNAAGEENISKAYAFDVSENDIIFGWILSDNITHTAGTLEFAVRFVLWNQSAPNIYTYSMSTLTASCVIKPALDFDMTGMVAEDLSDILISRPIYSGVVNSSFGAKPVILSEGNLLTVANLAGEKGTYDLVVKAYSPDRGTLSARWYQQPYINGQIETESGVLVTDETNIKVATPAEVGGTYTFTYTVDKAGSYYAVIGNTSNKLTRQLTSNACLIPYASEFRIQETMLERNYSDGAVGYRVTAVGANGADVEADAFNGVHYQWYLDDTPVGTDSDTWMPSATHDGLVSCVVTNKRNKDTVSHKTETVAVLRKVPVAPTNCVIEVEETSGSRTVYRCDVTTTDSRDLEYKWTDSALHGGSDATFTIDWEHKDYKDLDGVQLYCSVRQHIWAGDALNARQSDWKHAAGLYIDNPNK